MYEDKKAKAALRMSGIKGTFFIIIGSILTLIFGSTLIYTIFDSENDGIDMVITFIVLSLISLLILWSGIDRKKKINLYEDYVARLAMDSTFSLDKLATATSTSIDQVLKNVNYMIKKGFFQNAYIDTESRALVFSGKEKIQNAKEIQKRPVSETMVVSCSGCGATNKINVGFVNECEFCGTQISG